MEELAKHGTYLPEDILGLTDEQIEELKRVDEWGETCIPSGGFTLNRDPIGRRNGKQPIEKMQSILTRTIGEAKAAISKVISGPQFAGRSVEICSKLNLCRNWSTQTLL